MTPQRGWCTTENECYLLQFTLAVRCLCYTSFSLELCWRPPPAERPSYSLPWMLAYVFYYPVFHNGPVLSFPEFIAQVVPFEDCTGVLAGMLLSLLLWSLVSLFTLSLNRSVVSDSLQPPGW